MVNVCFAYFNSFYIRCLEMETFIHVANVTTNNITVSKKMISSLGRYYGTQKNDNYNSICSQLFEEKITRTVIGF